MILYETNVCTGVAIDKFGPGNWKSCSEYIGTKSTKQVEDHYWESYMGVHGYCLPSNVVAINSRSTFQTMDEYIEDVGKDNPELQKQLRSYYETTVNEGYSKGEEATRDTVGVVSKGRGNVAGSSMKDSSTEAKKRGDEKDKQAEIKEKNALLPGGDLPGFLPLREDFDVEYDNDAEMMLADLEFSEDDHPTERELKHQVIQIFNRKLEERNRRKRFAIDRGLVDFKKHQLADRKRCKEEKELVSRLRMFARFHTAEEHEALVDGILRARKLRLQIQAFQAYRKLGITTLDQARQYEIDRRKKESEMKQKKQRESESYLFQTGRKTDFTASSTQSSSSSLLSGGLDEKGGQRRGPARGRSGPELMSSGGKTHNASGENASDTVVMKSAPGAELLSTNELELCELLPMLPYHYLAIKEALIREASRSGVLSLEGVKRIVRVDIDKQTKLFDYFIRNTNIQYNEDTPPQSSHQKRVSDMELEGTASSAAETAADGEEVTSSNTNTKNPVGRKKKSPRV